MNECTIKTVVCQIPKHDMFGNWLPEYYKIVRDANCLSGGNRAELFMIGYMPSVFTGYITAASSKWVIGDGTNNTLRRRCFN